MTLQEAFAASMGLFAWDCGCHGSGVHDDVLRDELRLLVAERMKHDHAAFMKELSIFVRGEFLSDEALDAGMSIEDAANYCEWIQGPLCWN